MSSGLAPFGQLPQLAGFSADDLAALVQRMQAQQGQQPGQPQGSPSRFGAMPGQQADPQATGSLGQQPAVAMTEADVQRLEQPQLPPGMRTLTQAHPDFARLFDPQGMGGGPSGFSGQADPYGLRDVPLPPARPSDADLAVPAATGGIPQTQRQIVASSSYHPDAPGIGPRDGSGRPPGGHPGSAADFQAPSTGDYDPLTGAPLSANVQPIGAQPAPGQGRPSPGSPAPVEGSPMQQFLSGSGVGAAAGAAQPSTQPQGSPAGPAQSTASQTAPMAKFLGDTGLGGIIDNNRNLLLHIGTSLMSERGFGRAIAKGMQSAQEADRQDAVTGLSNLKVGMELRKLQQQETGRNDTIKLLVRAGHSPEAASSMVSAAAAGNSGALNHALGNLVPQIPANHRLAADGKSYEYIPGSEADPAVKERNALAVATDKAQTPLVDVEARRKVGIPDNDTRAAWADPNGKVTFNDGPPPLAARPGQTFYDRGTLKPILTAPPAKPESFDTETKLRTEFSKQLGSFADVHDGYGRVIAATKQRQDTPGSVSPAADIGLIFGYMKMLDPGSVVREGEYATAKNAAGVPDRVVNAYNKAVNGEFLSDRQRQDFIGQADSLYGTARKTAEGVAGRYRGLATQYSVDPDRSVYLPEAPTPPRLGGAPERHGQAQGQLDATPQPGGPALRYQQLRRGGMSAADAHARMTQEGF